MGQADRQNDGLGPAAPGAAEAQELKDRFYDLDFSVQKSRRYHERFCAFYGGWRDWVKIITVVAGSGLFLFVLGGWKHTSEGLAAFVALWAMIDYLVAPDKKAEKHCELCEKFINLAIEIENAERSEKTFKKLMTRRYEIEREEPPVKRLIDLQARNDECRARDFPPEDIVPLSVPQRTFGYFLTFGMDRLEEWKATRQRQMREAT
ncbi:MAG: hypothetical protein WCE79_20865 [Xanthobacteraceae bacterium]